MNIFLIYDIVYVRSVYQKLCSGNDRSSTIEFFFLFFCVPNKNSRELGDLHFLPFLTCWWPAFVQFTWKQNSISFIFIMFPYNMTLVERKNSYCASSLKTTNQSFEYLVRIGQLCRSSTFSLQQNSIQFTQYQQYDGFYLQSVEDCRLYFMCCFLLCTAKKKFGPIRQK